MKILIFILMLVLLIVISACQPAPMVKKEEKALADSVLYFQQLDLNDPFLDTVFNEPDKPVSIQKELAPPPPPPEVIPRFKEIEGFRVQIFAGIDSVNALPVLQQAETLTNDSIYYYSDKGLFKIQIGDYQFRYKADSARTYFRRSGFDGAWVVQRQILIPVDPDSLTISEILPDTTVAVGLIGEATGRYKIQIMALGDIEKVRLTAAALRSEYNYNAFYEQSGSLYKVFVGFFNSESSAREVLQKLRENGYPDAWLVY